MAKKKKKELPIRDTVLFWNSIIGGTIMLVIVVPPLPWREANVDQYLGSRFPTKRKVSLFSISDQMGMMRSWFQMKKQVCFKAQIFLKPSPVGMMKLMVSSSLPTGGAVMGCEAWQNCKNHAMMRCNGYTTLAGLGAFTMAVILLGAVLGFTVPLLLSFEVAIKKKKKLEEAKFQTMVVSVFAFVLPALGAMIWIFATDAIFKGFQNSSYYPYPAAHAGYFLAVAGIAVQSITASLGVYRIIKAKEPEEEDKDKDETEPMAEGQDPDMMFMGPAGMPGMEAPNPPGMGPPGMGPPGMGPLGMGPPGTGPPGMGPPGMMAAVPPAQPS